ACPIEAAGLEQSQSKLTFLLNDRAGLEDDLIITRLGGERFRVVANAGNAAAREAHRRKLARDFEARIERLDRAFRALQGPEAQPALKAAGIEPGTLTFMHGVEPRDGWFVSRSGYTGEDGFEIALPEADAREMLARLLQDERVQWTGLAA